MNRPASNFGAYEIEYRARVPRLHRLLAVVLRLVGAAVAVVLAGLFLFPVNAHAGRSWEQADLGTAAIERGMPLAERTAQAKDAIGANGHRDSGCLPRRNRRCAGCSPESDGTTHNNMSTRKT